MKIGAQRKSCKSEDFKTKIVGVRQASVIAEEEVCTRACVHALPHHSWGNRLLLLCCKCIGSSLLDRSLN